MELTKMMAPFLNMSKNRALDIYTSRKDILTFLTFYPELTNIALDRFYWHFPMEYEQLNSDYLERLLHFRGRACLINDKTKGYLIADFIIVDNSYNMMYEPQIIRAIDVVTGKDIGTYTNNGVNKEFVIIPNNELWVPSDIGIIGFVDDIVNGYNAIDNNNNQQKFPITFQGTKDQKADMEAVFKKLDSDDPYVFVNKEFNLDGITKLDISAPYMVKEIYDYIDRKKADAMTYLGVNNGNTFKQSGVTVEEVNGNNDLVSKIADSYIIPRQKALQKIVTTFPELADIELETNIGDNIVTLKEV